MSRRLKAVFRFRTPDDPERMKSPLKVLKRALRLLRTHDPDASLRVTPDDDPPVAHYDATGD